MIIDYYLFTLIAGILEASKLTLEQGQALLMRIREMGQHADIQSKHATTAACYGQCYLTYVT